MTDLAQQHGVETHPGDTRRDFLLLTAGAIGGVGVVATIWPFIDTLNPARDTLALSTTDWRGAPCARKTLLGSIGLTQSK